MKIHDVTQGSPEWLQLRAGLPTASELDNLLTPEFKVRTGQTPASYVARKAAEAWIGGPLFTFNSGWMDNGTILEDEAIPWFEVMHDTSAPVRRVGFITTDDGRFGASPDGLLPDDTGLEAKCPSAEVHVKYLLKGEVPSDYLAQVHGGMFATGAKSWTFLSYHRQFPKLVLKVERDEAIQAAIGKALDAFTGQFDEAMKRLTAMNGGERSKRKPVPPAPVEREVEDFLH
jgi:hypothetical protein